MVANLGFGPIQKKMSELMRLLEATQNPASMPDPAAYAKAMARSQSQKVLLLKIVLCNSASKQCNLRLALVAALQQLSQKIQFLSRLGRGAFVPARSRITRSCCYGIQCYASSAKLWRNTALQALHKTLEEAGSKHRLTALFNT